MKRILVLVPWRLEVCERFSLHSSFFATGFLPRTVVSWLLLSLGYFLSRARPPMLYFVQWISVVCDNDICISKRRGRMLRSCFVVDPFLLAECGPTLSTGHKIYNSKRRLQWLCWKKDVLESFNLTFNIFFHRLPTRKRDRHVTCMWWAHSFFDIWCNRSGGYVLVWLFIGLTN